jgi:hypothetical protein
LCLFAAASARAADDPTLFRLFLNDGTSLVSFGEIARVGDRVVFSMPTSASRTSPELQLVNIAASRVDWSRTTRYAESARANQYFANQAASDYAVLSNNIADALNAIGQTDDINRRLSIVERARKTLAAWPPQHFYYKQDEVRQMLAILDEAIADLQVRTGAGLFNLSLVASVAPPPVLEALLPRPTPKEAIEQTLMAARLTDSPVEHMSLMTMVVNGLERDTAVLPAAWRLTTLTTVKAEIAVELQADKAYDGLGKRLLGLAKERAQAADVKGLQRLITQVHDEDATLGGKRRDMIAALVDSIQVQLDEARRLQLERDRWNLRVTAFRSYKSAIQAPLAQLSGLRAPLEDIKALAGSGPDALGLILRRAGQALKALSAVTPPDEFRSAHALLLSASQLAGSAARTRREAALTGDLGRAWDASSAAAGAIMLTERARSDIATLLRPPQLPQ